LGTFRRIQSLFTERAVRREIVRQEESVFTERAVRREIVRQEVIFLKIDVKLVEG